MFQQYKQIERNILNTQMDLKMLYAEREKLISLCGPKDVKAQQYDVIPGSRMIISAEDQILQLAICQQRIVIYEEYLGELKRIKVDYEDEIQRQTERFNSLEYKVFIKHHIEKQPLVEVAADLDYDYGYIRKINMNLIKEIKDGTKTEHIIN